MPYDGIGVAAPTLHQVKRQWTSLLATPSLSLIVATMRQPRLHHVFGVPGRNHALS